MSDFAKKLKTAREYNKLSMKDLSKLTGISDGLISDYENSKKKPNIVNLIKLCQALGVSADYMLGLEKSIDLRNIK